MIALQTCHLAAQTQSPACESSFVEDFVPLGFYAAKMAQNSPRLGCRRRRFDQLKFFLSPSWVSIVCVSPTNDELYKLHFFRKIFTMKMELSCVVEACSSFKELRLFYRDHPMSPASNLEVNSSWTSYSMFILFFNNAKRFILTTS